MATLKFLFTVWLVLWLLITLLSWLVGQFLDAQAPLALRTFVVTLVAAPTMIFGVIPTVRRWLR
jgi:hypothetical protein